MEHRTPTPDDPQHRTGGRPVKRIPSSPSIGPMGPTGLGGRTALDGCEVTTTILLPIQVLGVVPGKERTETLNNNQVLNTYRKNP